MPIHLRAEPGDYAPAVLLPGDPLRAKRVATEFLDDARQVNGERGMLGFTGTYEGTPVSVQATGMGCPSAAIVIEELIQLGAERLIRIGTCGGLQPDLGLGETIIALSAVPGDATALRYTQGEPHAPTAHFGLTHGAIHAAKGLGIRPHVGGIASSDTFYDPDPGRHHRWAERGVLAVEMEAAVLFTIGALRGVKTACILTVSDLVTGEAPVRISDDDLAKGVERMTLLALAAAIDEKA
jgi:DeoD family purine-nucleoside phosphorylase